MQQEQTKASTAILFMQMIAIRFYLIATFRLGIKQSKCLTRKWYDIISTLCGTVFREFSCLNYGYTTKDLEQEKIHANDNGSERCQKQLYHYLLQQAHVDNYDSLRVLEIGSGRGGGLSYISQEFQPLEVIGLELSSVAVKYSQEKYIAIPNLRFIQGDAENLPFSNDYFDIIVNIESSHCYPSFTTFLSECARVLKSGGELLISDCRYKEKIHEFNESFDNNLFNVISKEDITDNVVHSLENDSERKLGIIQRSKLPEFVKKSMINFAGCKGGTTYNEFKERDRLYYNVICQKK